MRQSIGLNQTELDELASKAEELSNWLEDKTVQIATNVIIPPGLVAVGSIIAFAGMFIIMDGLIPDSVCWAGCTSHPV